MQSDCRWGGISVSFTLAIAWRQVVKGVMLHAAVMLAILLCGLLPVRRATAEQPHLRIGILARGSANWEMTIVKKFGLDTKRGFVLDVVPFAGKSATEVALQGGAVDIIVDDWFWVARQRSKGILLRAFPFSTTVGGIVVPKDSSIQDLRDLEGKKIGLAGGPVDKSWLLLRAVYMQRYGRDPQKSVETIAVSPPMASLQMQRGELDAIVQFWHFIARLVAAGNTRRLVMVDALMQELGLSETVPLLVYVFKEDFVRDQLPIVQSFVKAVYEAKRYLQTRDEVWNEIRSLVRAPDEHTLKLIREAWRRGVPSRWDAQTFANMQRLFDVLRQIGGKKLVGADTIPAGTFLTEISF